MEGNLTKGPIMKTLVKLAVPIMASAFLGTLYNITDMAWIGLLGSKAVAGVGVGGMFTWLSQGLASMARMGGQVQVDGRVAVIEGVEYLTGAPVQACDLRAGAALVIAGLAARGVTELTQVQFIERDLLEMKAYVYYDDLGKDIRVEEIPEAQEAEAHIG